MASGTSPDVPRGAERPVVLPGERRPARHRKGAIAAQIPPMQTYSTTSMPYLDPSWPIPDFLTRLTNPPVEMTTTMPYSRASATRQMLMSRA